MSQLERSDCEKNQFYNEMACKWDLQNPDEMVLGMGDMMEMELRKKS